MEDFKSNDYILQMDSTEHYEKLCEKLLSMAKNESIKEKIKRYSI